MAGLIRVLLPLIVLVAVIGVGYRVASDYISQHPQDFPWTPLALDDPIGRFTLGKIAALADEPGQCRLLLEAVGSGHRPVPQRRIDGDCGYEDGMKLGGPGADYRPAGEIVSCPVAAAMTIFEEQILRPAAMRHFGQPVTVIDHAGSFSCRRLYGRAEGRFSEHATADAFDITGFRLADGTRISVLADWAAPGPKSAFLKETRDGACRLFATVLSPDYNAAHADHLHVDQAQRGRIGSGFCR